MGRKRGSARPRNSTGSIRIRCSCAPICTRAAPIRRWQEFSHWPVARPARPLDLQKDDAWHMRSAFRSRRR